MSEILKETPRWYRIILFIMIAIFVVAIIIPPPGIVDASVIEGMAIIGLLAFLGLLPGILAEKHNVTVTKGDLSVKVEDKSE